jgi:hypothetical protein
MQHIWLDPEGVTRVAGPRTQSGWPGHSFIGHSLRDDGTGRVRIDSFFPTNAPHTVALLSLLVAIIEREAVRHLFNGVAVEIDLEFVHTFRMVAGDFRISEGVANVDHEYGADWAAECVEIRDIKANILSSDG